MNTGNEQRVVKTAVDSATKDYWASYFGAYGKDLVRSIKKRVLASLIATKRAKADATLRPVAFVRSERGYTVEAAVRSGETRLVICASLSPTGDVLALRGLDQNGVFFEHVEA